MEILTYAFASLGVLGTCTLGHLPIVAVAVSIAAVTAVPIGLAITQSRRAADVVLYLPAEVITVPLDPPWRSWASLVSLELDAAANGRSRLRTAFGTKRGHL